MNKDNNKGLFGSPIPQENPEKEKVVVDLKKEAKIKNGKKENRFKKFFFGVGKEFERISWTSRKELASSFLITIVVVCFFGVIFTLISIAITVA